MQLNSSTATYTAYVGEAGAAIYLTGTDPATTSGDSLDLIINIYNPSSTAFKKLIDWQGTSTMAGNAQRVMRLNGAAVNSNTGALTGIKLYMGGGNIVAGKFRLYGLSNS
jgi:hypothetical protein